MAPDNASYWSELAYIHYQNVQELTQSKGRRDGNVRKEIQAALECYEKTLALDPRRIKDHRRKGYLLADVLPDQILWGRDSDDREVRSANAKEKRLQGIESYRNAVSLWESLSPENEREMAERKRCRRDYVRALYGIGRAYSDLIVNGWDEAVFSLNLREGIVEQDSITSNPEDRRHVDNALAWLKKCWSADDPAQSGSEELCEHVDKLYRLGEVFFQRYWLLSGYGQKDTAEACIERDRAQKYFAEALKTPWSAEKARQKKDHIAERMARVFITKEEYDNAVAVIRGNCSRRLDAYVANTLALALHLNGRHSEARQVLAEAAQDRNNKDIWATWFLSGCSFLEENRFDEAIKSFDKADNEARRMGKETVDTMLIARAFVAYKSGNRGQALSYLEQAVKLNPYRLAAQRRLECWRKETELSITTHASET